MNATTTEQGFPSLSVPSAASERFDVVLLRSAYLGRAAPGSRLSHRALDARHAASTDAPCGPSSWEVHMSFIIGLILFVVVIGVLDARLPWPKPRATHEVRS
jgi:hypothetical protein